ncbi:ACB domain-containing protein [Caenorhabditis elegans]|uniref:ACB domain-containing protein n=1 Tax=Caenorhabditis elegans TaxID=6239 RepID=M1ZJ43_CAEEL|nr:ACB domain-containing protein [Caenorhabditis elegans]CCU83332.1 ACB domain-containing protein [Caenorhabditis elegans]|eukprot:NP_001294234.1 Uncharacterized protein CELE_Y41E3.7 [Caenorhabditis elegans]
MADENHVRLSEVQLIQSEFGHSLEECYKLAVQYYKKEHVGKQEPVGYEDRIKLLSLSKQVQHGEISDEFDNAGWLDITGNDVNDFSNFVARQYKFVFLLLLHHSPSCFV